MATTATRRKTMTSLHALTVLESRLGNWQIDNGDDCGPHHVSHPEARRAANVLRGTGAPRFANHRQIVAWAYGLGFDVVLDERST